MDNLNSPNHLWIEKMLCIIGIVFTSLPKLACVCVDLSYRSISFQYSPVS